MTFKELYLGLEAIYAGNKSGAPWKELNGKEVRVSFDVPPADSKANSFAILEFNECGILIANEID